MSSIQILPHRSENRGNADYGWLKTFHSYSWARAIRGFDAEEHDHWGCLLVINEDRVQAHTGFGTHPHREFEIFSYVVSGELEHRDSMGNTEILKRGDLQMTSAGTGIRHSERAHGDKDVHFLQIWSLPTRGGLTPQYFTRHFSDEEKKDKWARIVAPVDAEGVIEKREAGGAAPVHSPLTLFATILSPSKSLDYKLERPKGYIHVVQTSGYHTGKATGGTVKVSGSGKSFELREGDGAYLSGADGEVKLENVGDRATEILLFDLDEL
ncbi:RmlC-like cupin [Panus rudis PR-1116 ss-1]|nr:RmlC-like cupin [Panus rudis PR-1116 ss-1]